MKKIYYLALALTIVFVSCEKEDVSEVEDSLEAINHSYRYKKKKKKNCDPVLDVESTLPIDINFCSTDRGTNTGLSYWDITINDSDLAGDYQAWCLDANRGLGIDCFDATVVSSNSDLSETPITITENFDVVNWIINNNFVGKDSPSGLGQYTFGDVQVAIWHFVDDANEPWEGNRIGEWNEARAQEIIDQASSNGENYEPQPGELFCLIILPTDTLRQPLLLPYQLEKCEDEKPKCKKSRCKGRWYKHYGKYKKCRHYNYYKKKKWRWWRRW